MGDTFQRTVGIEDGGVVCSRSGSTVSEIELEGYLEVSCDKTIFIEAGKTVNVFHHPC